MNIPPTQLLGREAERLRGREAERQRWQWLDTPFPHTENCQTCKEQVVGAEASMVWVKKETVVVMVLVLQAVAGLSIWTENEEQDLWCGTGGWGE